MGSSSKQPDFSELCRRCSMGDTYAPQELLQCCIEALTLFDGTLPSDVRLTLIDKVKAIINGVAFITSGNEEENIIQLNNEIEVLQNSIRQALETNRICRNDLGIITEDFSELQKESALLKELITYKDFRKQVKEKYPDQKMYLDALCTMSLRANKNHERLKELEKQCVDVMTEMESLFREALIEEEESWERKEERITAKQ